MPTTVSAAGQTRAPRQAGRPERASRRILVMVMFRIAGAKAHLQDIRVGAQADIVN